VHRELNVTHEPENDRFVISFENVKNIEIVYLSGSAAAEFIGGGTPDPRQQNCLGDGIADYLVSKGLSSMKDNPLFVVPLLDIQAVENSHGITPELSDSCNSRLEE